MRDTLWTRAEEVSRRAQQSMQSAAQYLREHSMEQMISDAETYLGGHPGTSLLSAVAIGFLVGRTFRVED